ncbi:MAG: ATP-binding cassette domain-containing protein [Holosporaceae bacterium]|jgi:cell division transport system ATP-binding protein|nr:ATP-binding cassette domain-containing protein [Holosporaceae bacterium]
MSKEEPIISLEKVMLTYEDGAPVLRDISLSLYRKSFHFLTGASGAGKTTLMRLLYMGIKHFSGNIKIFGRDISNISPEDQCKLRRRMGVVFQDFNLLNHLTVLENVALPLKIMGEEKKRREHQAKEILEWVGLGNCVNVQPHILSGGQKQRIAIARAVIAQPDILLADEPTGNVDEKIAHKLMRLFYGMHKTGTCVIVATHYRQFVDKFHYNELHISNGHIIDRNYENGIQNNEFF